MFQMVKNEIDSLVDGHNNVYVHVSDGKERDKLSRGWSQ